MTNDMNFYEIIEVPGDDPIVIEHGTFGQEAIDFIDELLAEEAKLCEDKDRN